MTKSEFLDAIDDIPMDAELLFSMDVSEPGHEGMDDEEENAGKRAFGTELIEVVEGSLGELEYVIVIAGELNF